LLVRQRDIVDLGVFERASLSRIAAFTMDRPWTALALALVAVFLARNAFQTTGCFSGRARSSSNVFRSRFGMGIEYCVPIVWILASYQEAAA
jgi:hypothetical protein